MSFKHHWSFSLELKISKAVGVICKLKTLLTREIRLLNTLTIVHYIHIPSSLFSLVKWGMNIHLTIISQKINIVQTKLSNLEEQNYTTEFPLLLKALQLKLIRLTDLYTSWIFLKWLITTVNTSTNFVTAQFSATFLKGQQDPQKNNCTN